MKIALLIDLSLEHGIRLAGSLYGRVDLMVISPKKPRIPVTFRYDLVPRNGSTVAAYINQAPAINRILDRFSPDLVHAVNIMNNGVFAHEYGRAPYVSTILGSDLYMLGNKPRDIRKRIQAGLIGARMITADSLDQIRVCQAIGIPFEHLSLWSYGVDTELFRPYDGVPHQVDRIRADHCPVIVSGRKLGDLYNHDLVIDMFVKLLGEFPEALLIFVGDFLNKEYEIRILEKIADLGLGARVEFLPVFDYRDLPDLYNAADLYISAARSDGLPVSILEAMACGTPVLASDLPSIREILDFGNLTPLNPGDMFERARAILTMDPAFLDADLVAKREFIRAEYENSNEIDQLLQLYSKVTSGEPVEKGVLND